MNSLTPFKDDLPVPEIIKAAEHCGTKKIVIEAHHTEVSLHADLPGKAGVWQYRHVGAKVIADARGETFLGPTIEVEKEQELQIEWHNRIDGILPYAVVKANASDDLTPQNVPGRQGVIPAGDDMVRIKAKKLHAALVTHLHGARTHADSDGWPDNTLTHGQKATYTYPNRQAASMLWYHDHAMHVTRLNVYAGLAGCYLIRDENEESLNLPSGEFEIPLVIQDRNLDADENGFTGQMLHKVEVNDGSGPAEFFGPYTLVNGKIWPRTSVKKAMYRLRLLNGSNARSYRLLFLDDNGKPIKPHVMQIGCDQGLMEAPVPLPSHGLILMPAERADILIDFRELVGSVYLWNTAEAPFDNDPKAIPDAKAVAAELQSLLSSIENGTEQAFVGADKRRVYPQVIRFDVEPGEPTNNACLPCRPLAVLDYKNPAEIKTVRLMALVENQGPASPDTTTMLAFREFVPQSAANPGMAGSVMLPFTPPHLGEHGKQENYFVAAEGFYDKLNWLVHLNSHEVWYIVNLCADAHPIHLHLVDFTVVGCWDCTASTDIPLPESGLFNMDVNITGLNIGAQRALEPNAIAPKDTVKVEPQTLLAIAAKFGPYTGRYMYHCHILEHEDHDMMRPFVVVPEWVPHHDM